jgi:hypothetical protein
MGLTKGNDPDSLEKASIEYKVAFDLSTRFRWDPKALGDDCDDNDYHADQRQGGCFRQLPDC